jgi:hypothetical protein
MLRFLIPAALLITLSLAGCGPRVEPKTENPIEIEKIRQQAIENSQREINSSKPQP